MNKSNILNTDLIFTPQNDKTVKQLFSKCVALSSKPISIFEDKGIKFLIKALLPAIKIPNRRDLLDELKYYAKLIENKLTDLFVSSIAYSLSLDIWTKRNDSIIGAKVKFINEDLKTATYCLDFQKILDHKSQTITDYLKLLIDNYSMDIKKISSICTDNASNFKKYVKNLDMHLQNDDNDSEYESDLNLENNIYFKFNENLNINCQIHTLQLIINDLFKNIKEFKKLIKKSKIIALKINKEIPDLTIPLSTPVRWNSIVKMNNYIIENIKKIEDYYSNTESNEIPLIITDKKFKDNLIESTQILYPILIITKYLEKDDILISEYSNLIFSYIKRLELVKKSFAKNTFSYKIANQILLSIKTRIIDNENLLDIFKISIFLDPIKFRLWNKDYKIGKEEFLKILEKYNFYNDKVSQKVNYFNTQDKKVKICEIIDNKITQIMNSSFDDVKFDNTNIDTIENEIDYYLSNNYNIEAKELWMLVGRKFKRLKSIYLSINSIIFSNGSIERLFAESKFLSYWKKNKILIENIRIRLMVNNGFDLIK